MSTVNNDIKTVLDALPKNKTACDPSDDCVFQGINGICVFCGRQIGKPFKRPEIYDPIERVCEAVVKQRELLDSLLNKVNVVTGYHRHGNEVSSEMLDELANRQIEVEEALKGIS